MSALFRAAHTIALLALCQLAAFRVEAGASLAEFWEEKAIWVKDADKIGASFDFHFLSILRNQNELWAYHIHNYTAPDGKFKMAIGRARGTDGINWTNDSMVLDVSHQERATNGSLPLWDDRLSSFPGIWKDGETWYLVYEGAGENVSFSPGDIGLATSKDGSNFVKHPENPILRHNPDGWERVNIGTPSLFKEHGVWYLFYHGYDGNVCQIGVASGPTLTNLTRSTANPILPVSPDPASWDSGTIGKRSSIIKEDGYYYLAFEGSTPQPFAQSKWSSSLAASTNLTSGWLKLPGKQMIPQTPGGMGYDGPELFRIGGVWYLYVRTPASNQTERFRLQARARS
jgi:hypothetical protein